MICGCIYIKIYMFWSVCVCLYLYTSHHAPIERKQSSHANACARLQTNSYYNNLAWTITMRVSSNIIAVANVVEPPTLYAAVVVVFGVVVVVVVVIGIVYLLHRSISTCFEFTCARVNTHRANTLRPTQSIRGTRTHTNYPQVYAFTITQLIRNITFTWWKSEKSKIVSNFNYILIDLLQFIYISTCSVNYINVFFYLKKNYTERKHWN